MEVKGYERDNLKGISSYIIICILYLSLVLIFGHSVSNFYIVTGSVIFILLFIYTLRSYFLAFFALTNRGNKKLLLPDNLPKISFVIPSFNEEAVLTRTIPTALSLDYPYNKLEFIYVYESACTDKTEEIILSFAKKDPRIKPICRPTKKGGKAPITNYGIEYATGEIIGVFDADHSLDSDLARYAAMELQDPNIGCVRGRCRVINPNYNILTSLVAMERNVIECFGICGSYRMLGFTNFGGGHGFFRKSMFNEIGLFNEQVLTEDIDFSVRLYLAGYKIAALPEMVSWEEAPISFNTFLSQRKRWSRGWMQICIKYLKKILTSKKILLITKLDMLFCLVSSLSPGLLIFLFPFMALSALGINTSIFNHKTSFIMWLFITTAPVIQALLVSVFDFRKKSSDPGVKNFLLFILFVPYILVLLIIAWMGFVDEFILCKPQVYVKTQRELDSTLTAP